MSQGRENYSRKLLCLTGMLCVLTVAWHVLTVSHFDQTVSLRKLDKGWIKSLHFLTIRCESTDISKEGITKGRGRKYRMSLEYPTRENEILRRFHGMPQCPKSLVFCWVFFDLLLNWCPRVSYHLHWHQRTEYQDLAPGHVACVECRCCRIRRWEFLPCCLYLPYVLVRPNIFHKSLTSLHYFSIYQDQRDSSGCSSVTWAG